MSSVGVVTLGGNAMPVFDVPMKTVNDITTNASYTYVSKTAIEDAATTDYVWFCYRITNANGTIHFPTHPTTGVVSSAPDKQASAAATYTYA